MAFIATQEPFKLQAILRRVATQNKTLLNSHEPEVIVERKQLISWAASDDPGTQVAASSTLLGHMLHLFPPCFPHNCTAICANLERTLEFKVALSGGILRQLLSGESIP